MDTYKLAVSTYALDHKIPQGDTFWGTFNGSFHNVSLETQEIIQAVYDGHPITTWHKDAWRTSANYLCGQTIGLDFDAENESARLSTLIKDSFIKKYAAFVHTTMSHRDDAPRARALFVLDQPIMQAKNYVLAASALLWSFGTADRACRDAVRFWYGSPKCDFEYINQVLPLSTVKHLIATYQESGEREKHKVTRPGWTAPPDQQEVAAALKMIPPWGIEYDEWVQVLMGIHSAFGQDGYSLAESWAQGKQGEIDHKWRSFKPGGAVTIATVFGIAKRFGWVRA